MGEQAMTRTALTSVRRVVQATAIALIFTLFPLVAAGQEAITVTLLFPGIALVPAHRMVLLERETVQEELKMNDFQKKERAAIHEKYRQKLEHARRGLREMGKLLDLQKNFMKEEDAENAALLEPGQRERLDQILFQAQGPLAFAHADMADGTPFTGPQIGHRLKLTIEQGRRTRAILNAKREEIRRSASFPITLDVKDGQTETEAIAKLVDTPEFQRGKKDAIRAGINSRAGVIRLIEEILTEEQRTAYQRMLGEAFDLSKLNSHKLRDDERDWDIELAKSALRLVSRPDPAFATKSVRPAYHGGHEHPRVLFDEAHRNRMTAGGRYKPFVALIASDGYSIIPNREPYSRKVLEKCDILVIANAVGPKGISQRESLEPAFTDSECGAIRDWITDGGALLLIVDQAPTGAAADCLAKPLGVRISNGVTVDPSRTEWEEIWLVFTRQNQLLGDHPITQGRDESERVNRVQTFSGTSLKGPAGSVPILKLPDTAVDRPTIYSKQGTSATGRVQGVAFGLGGGRVVVMGDADALTAQLADENKKYGMNVPGLDNRQLVLNIMHWLSGLLEPREGAVKKAG